MKIKINSIKNILLLAVIVRFIALIVILLFKDMLPSFGFIGNSPIYDDFRYEEGANLYSQIASNIVDIPVFTSIYANMGDWVGYHLGNPFTGTYLWYWICCILVYIFKTRIAIRVMNILFSILTINVVYKLANELFGQRVALITSWILALFPYFVVFSCFSYKDVLVSLLTFYIWLFFIDLKKRNINSIGQWLRFILATIILFSIRSGLSAILIIFCLFYYISDKIKFKTNRKHFIISIIVLLVFVAIWDRFGDVILYKFKAYFENENTVSTGLSRFLVINSIYDLWKLPIVFEFSILQPISFRQPIDSWFGIISNLNVLMIPIAVGAGLYLLQKHKTSSSATWFLFLYYLVTAASSVLIFRQIYSLLPIPVMMFANYVSYLSEKKIIWLTIGTILFIVILILIF